MLLFYMVEITERIINPDLNDKKNLNTLYVNEIFVRFCKKMVVRFYDLATDFFDSSLFCFLTSRGQVFKTTNF